MIPGLNINEIAKAGEIIKQAGMTIGEIKTTLDDHTRILETLCRIVLETHDYAKAASTYVEKVRNQAGE